MNSRIIPHDERTESVENASYRWGYILLSFGLLLIVTYRGFALGESSWDLLALVILGGAVTTLYQGYHRILSGRVVMFMLVTAVISAIVAAILVLVQ